MLWLNPLLLAGLVTLAAPILIHLLMKIQGRRTPFSTLRFFAKAQGSRDRKKIRHWPLLLVRLLALILLVTAFARPFWPAAKTEAAQARARAVLILIDRSASMQARVSDSSQDTRWTAALAAARKKLESLSDKDRAALVADAEQAEVVAPWGQPAAILTALNQLQPTNEAGRMADGLQVAGTLLDQAPTDSSRELILVSDLQKSSFRELDSASVPEGAHSEVVPVAQPGMVNVAVNQLARQDTSSRTLKVVLQNFSVEKQAGLSLSCSLDSSQQPFFEQKIDLEAGAQSEVVLPDLPAKAGWNQLAVTLKSDDQLPADNQLFSAINIPTSVPVLVAEPAMGDRVFRRASYFLTSALDPDSVPRNANLPPDPNAAARPFAITVIDAGQLLNHLATLSAPAVHEVLILPPLPDVPRGLGAALKTFVANGGGLLGWVGPRMDTVGYNTELADLWPAQFTGVETNTDSTAGNAWHIGWWKKESPLFSPFLQGHSDLTLPGFSQRARLAATPDAEVLATFDDKAPFILSRPIGKGRVLLLNTSPDAHWSDWPRRKTYLPLVQFMTAYLGQSDARAGLVLAPSQSPTRHGQIDLGAKWAGQQLQLIPPGGKAVVAQPDEKGILRNLDLEQPGPYEIRDSSNAVLQCLAVNFPAAESDPENFSPDEVTGQLRFEPPSSGNAALIAADPLSQRHELWPWLLALLLPLLLVELILANRART